MSGRKNGRCGAWQGQTGLDKITAAGKRSSLALPSVFGSIEYASRKGSLLCLAERLQQEVPRHFILQNEKYCVCCF